MEKMNRIEDYKVQKNIIANQKREMQEQISRKKQQYAEKFEKIFKNKGIEDLDSNTIQNMFPGNNQIIDMISSKILLILMLISCYC